MENIQIFTSKVGCEENEKGKAKQNKTTKLNKWKENQKQKAAKCKHTFSGLGLFGWKLADWLNLISKHRSRLANLFVCLWITCKRIWVSHDFICINGNMATALDKIFCRFNIRFLGKHWLLYSYFSSRLSQIPDCYAFGRVLIN